jgi:hypothetical protein
MLTYRPTVSATLCPWIFIIYTNYQVTQKLYYYYNGTVGVNTHEANETPTIPADVVFEATNVKSLVSGARGLFSKTSSLLVDISYAYQHQHHNPLIQILTHGMADISYLTSATCYNWPQL